MRYIILSIFISFMFICSTAGAEAFKDLDSQKIDSEGFEYSYFGEQMVIEGNILVTSDYRATVDKKDNVGLLYIYEWDVKTKSWIKNKFKPDKIEDGHYFGVSLAIHNERVYVGCHADYIYMYEKSFVTNKWEHTKLTYKSEDYFGYTVAVNDKWLAASVYCINEMDYLCFYTNNNEEYEFHSTVKIDHSEEDCVVHKLVIEDDTLVVGLRTCIENEFKYFVYLFEYDGESWQQICELKPRGRYSSKKFGYAIDIDGSTIVVGSYKDGEDGAVYLFKWKDELKSWSERKIVPTHKYINYFGRSVDLKGDILAVGATLASPGGKVLLYNLKNRKELCIDAIEAISGAYFGESIRITDKMFFSGAIGRPAKGGGLYICSLKKIPKSLYKVSSVNIKRSPTVSIKSLAPIKTKPGKSVIFTAKLRVIKGMRCQWQMSSEPMPDQETSGEYDTEWGNIRGATKTRYKLSKESAKIHSGKHLRCVITYPSGSVTTNGARLLVE